ncbi:MAG TPA: AMP-binding protein [Sporichthya sp.]|nr:AMP-binding protein [Sporichthya sp.]
MGHQAVDRDDIAGVHRAPFVGIGRYVRSWARTQPDVPAVEMASGAVRTYAELDVRSQRLAHGLLAMGCTPGDRVGIWLGNCLEYLDVYLACAKAGLVVVPVNGRFTPVEADYVLGDADVRLLVYCSEIAEQVATLEHRPILVASDDLDLVIGKGTTHPLPDPAPDNVLILGYTSGTTGTPKGAELTHGSVERLALTNALSCRYRMGSVHVFGMSLSFTATVPAHVLPHLVVGGTTVLHRSWDTEAMLDTIERRRGNFVIVPSPVLNEVAAAVRARPHAAASLVAALHSASKAPVAALADLVDALGDRVIEGWGMTENSGGLFTASHATDLTSGDPLLLGSAGRPVPGTEVEVRDPDVDGVGQLWTTSPALFRGYWRNAAATADALVDGWFNTGDLGTVCGGVVTVVDRRADLINSGGMNVYPSEIERVLLDSGLVAECAVVAAPHPRWGQVPVAFIVPLGSGVDAGLSRYLTDRLADYKRPTRIITLEALPRNAGSKLERRRLVELAATE